MELRDGSIYDEDDFKVVRRLGYGDMGTVFLAVLRETGQPFAIKVMSKEVVRDRNNGYRAERELEILSALDHPFLPRLFTHFESKKNLFLVTEYCPGADMNILRQRQPERRFTECAARFYAAEVLLAIQYLHKVGIVYRDLKPENVLIQEDGHIMLTDFDLSVKLPPAQPELKTSKSSKRSCSRRFTGTPFMCANPMSVDVVCGSHRAVDVKPSHRVTKKIFPSELRSKRGGGGGSTDLAEVRSMSFVGTEEYVAPEMILGSGHGKPLDWWTFGIFLYELVYGTTPFKGRNRRETFYNILTHHPSFLGEQTLASDLICKLLVKDPRNRLGSAGGAEEIQLHPFFEGVDWEAIQHVARPPWVPPPLVVEEHREVVIEELMKQSRPMQQAPVKGEPPESEMADGGTSDLRSSSASSTITDGLSDVEPAGVSAPRPARPADTFAMF